MEFPTEKERTPTAPPRQDSHLVDEAVEDPGQSSSSPHERLDHPSSSTDSDTDFDTDDESPKKKSELDGHRPSLRETRSTYARSLRNRSRRSLGLTASNDAGLEAAGPVVSRVVSRRQTALGRLRSRPSTVWAHPLSHIPTTADVLVDFDGKDDPYHPLNWPIKKKIATTMMYGLVTMTATFASSSYSASTALVARHFDVSDQVAVLGTTIFLMGFGIGPLVWAPLSEVFGRRAAVLTPMFVATCFSFGSATAKDFQTLMITRFFCAFFCSAPVTNTGGVLGDLFLPTERGIAIAGYAMAVVGGPVLGPIISAAAVGKPYLGWRWSEYITGILQIFILLIAVIFVDESYPPVLLVYKARRLRHETGNWALHAKFEEWDVSIAALCKKFLIRPVQLLCTPICILMCLYASFCYGILYMQLGGIPFIFGQIRGWKPFAAELPFLSILVGAVIGCAVNVYNQLIYNKYYHAAGDRAVPEKRLPPMMLGSLLFAGGQFLTGWTAEKSIHWIVPCIGLTMLGAGFFMIFQAALNYLVDTFTMYAASAVAANTFLRSCFAAGFPLAVTPMYKNIGTGPGSSITGGFAALLIPVPFVFYVFGKRIRARGKWSKHSVYDD